MLPILTSFKQWWNTPTENLMTKGHNIIVLLGQVVPVGVVVLFIIFKLFEVVMFSWWYVVSPLLLPVVTLFIMKLSPRGRDLSE